MTIPADVGTTGPPNLAFDGHVALATGGASEVDGAVEDAVRCGGGPHHVVNNAGIIGRRMTVSDLDVSELDRVLKVNVASAFYVTHAALKHAPDAPGRTVVNLPSTAATTGGMPGSIASATTKGAIASLTIALAKELALDVRVNAVARGVIDTPFRVMFSPTVKTPAGSPSPSRCAAWDNHRRSLR